jgi:predicted ABC-type ATPase
MHRQAGWKCGSRVRPESVDAAMPRWVMVAGPNGSGKSTLIAALRGHRRFGAALPKTYVNADDIARTKRLDAQAAQLAATLARERALASRRDVMYETVMSHPSKLAELQRARAAGFEVHVFLVATADPAINVQRVALRVAAGGHDVPEDRTRRRYVRCLALAPVALDLADEALVFDNSDGPAGLRLQAQRDGACLTPTTDALAGWSQRLVDASRSRADELSRLLDDADAPPFTTQARWTDGTTQGVVERIGRHFVAQRDDATGLQLVHDRALLPADAPLVPGRLARIAYRDGVAHVSLHGLQ